MERVMVLSMGFGTGHNAAARAVAEELRQNPGVTVQRVDLLELVPNSFHPLLQSGYNRMLSRFPLFYHYLYDGTSQSGMIRSVSSGFIEKMGWMIRKRLNALLEEFLPTRLISTHPFSLMLLPSRWRELSSTGVLTDYELHPLWLVRVPDVLCIPAKLLNPGEQKRLQWHTGCRIVETGIPLHDGFRVGLSKDEARARLGATSGAPLILVMGGGWGYGPLPEIVEELSLMESPAEIRVLTGKNERLLQELNSRRLPPCVQVDRYRKDVPLLMDAAHLLITKPGGVSVTEAMVKGLPLLLFEALPGQEQANRQYLLRHGAALSVKPATLRGQVDRLLSKPEQLELLGHRLKALAIPDAATRIVQEALQVEPLHSAL